MIKAIKIFLVVHLIFFFPITFEYQERETKDVDLHSFSLVSANTPVFDVNNFQRVETVRDIMLTNYYVGDSTNSRDITSTGHTSRDFKINSQGWYTLNGRVVVAAATYICLSVRSGACGSYNTKPKGLVLHSLYDEIIIRVNGRDYDAIVIDSCGACMRFHSSDNYIQRYDIFVAGKKYAFGKLNAEIVEWEMMYVTLYTERES